MADGARRKGLGPLAWVAIGCGALLVIGVLVVGGLTWWGYTTAKQVAGGLDFEANPGLAAARLAIRLNPELEEVAIDEEAGTITVRNTATGEELTVDWSEIEQGRMRFSSGDKEFTVEGDSSGEGGGLKVSGGEDGGFELSTGNRVSEEIPAWVPVPDGAEPANRHAMSHAEGTNGGFQLELDQPVGEILELYRERLSAEGFAVRINTFQGDGESGGMVTGTDEPGGRNVVVMVREESGTAAVTVSYRTAAP